MMTMMPALLRSIGAIGLVTAPHRNGLRPPVVLEAVSSSKRRLVFASQVTVAAVACKGTEVLPLVVDFGTALP
jgi:hypothetical protein